MQDTAIDVEQGKARIQEINKELDEIEKEYRFTDMSWDYKMYSHNLLTKASVVKLLRVR